MHEVEIGDEELTALALAGDPDAELPEDAVPFGGLAAADDHSLPPTWYMPATRRRGGGPVRRVVIGGIVGALLLVSGAGLCVTYGLPQIAW